MWEKTKGVQRGETMLNINVFLKDLFGLSAKMEFLMDFKVNSCTLTHQDGLGWLVIAVAGAPGLGLLHSVPVHPSSQLVGQPVEPTSWKSSVVLSLP